MNAQPMTKLIDKAIASARGGSVRKYLMESSQSAVAVNERTLRNGFANLREIMVQSEEMDQAHEMMRNLNGFYRTRFSLDKLEGVVPIVCTAISDNGWWRTPPPRIRDMSAAEVDAAKRVVPRILKETADGELDRPYSLVTKFLHFCFHDTFGIYDARAASSIQTWSYFTFPLENDEWKHYDWLVTSNTSGEGYSGIVDFYRHCWAQATDRQITALESVAHDLSSEIGVPVSALYVLDNLMWNAAGDPRYLGLI